MLRTDLIELLNVILGEDATKRDMFDILADLDKQGKLDAKKRNQLIAVILKAMLDEK